MYKKFVAVVLIVCLQIIAVIFFQKSYRLFQLQPTEVAALPIQQMGVLVPLDNRPPCLLFPVQLARLGSLQLQHPDITLMGNYQTKGQTEKIQTWLYDNTTNQAGISIVSTDMLVHGGLVASREAYTATPNQATTLELFARLNKQYPQLFQSAFAIIPRLTIAENNQTSPWQWHMREYTVLQDIVNTFDNPIAFKKWQSFDKVIPAELKAKYQQLYAQNNNFNQLLIQEFDVGILNSVTIGQDDAAAFGLPNHNLHSAERYLPDNSNLAQVTRGADEISQLLVAQYLNLQAGYQPRVFVQYSQADTGYKIMPYMSCSVQETVEEKVAISGGQIVDAPHQADFILYVHCGDNSDTVVSLLSAALSVKKLLNNGQKVALVDLSRNFRSQDTLLPYLVMLDAPLPQLIAYTGWNTTSNSIGTAVAQAAIFTLQNQQLADNLKPSLYLANLEFTLARFIDDWGYQKNIQHETNYNLLSRDRNPYMLGSQTKITEDIITKQLLKVSKQLLYLNISRHAFFQSANKRYFVTQITPLATLPWQRTFEIQLQLNTAVGTQKID